ncbi:deoxyuridine 5'-triphosphate nucleotidohydrolase [Synergistales bacterium]|nr:deoxyuridine 5'-triphosphate nucleotidohydrolase [Synergistales bacterium]
MNTLKVKLLNSAAKLPTRAYKADAGLDLYAVEKETIPPKTYKTIHFGIAMEIPVGYVGKVHIRSGLASRGYSIMQGVGVIDAGYRGEIMATILNCNQAYAVIEQGERVCQLLIEPIELPDVIQCDELSKSDRDTGGFGSTGK